jgi:hypothetical protein
MPERVSRKQKKPPKKTRIRAIQSFGVPAPENPVYRGGKPSTYDERYAGIAQRLCARSGATDLDLADYFQVDVSTIRQWRIKYPEFDRAMKLGKEVPDDRVEASLYQRAVGYTFDSEKIFLHEGVPVRVATREYIPPDVTAQIFWLKNRRPEQWRDVYVRRDEEVKLDPDALREEILKEINELGLDAQLVLPPTGVAPRMNGKKS